METANLGLVKQINSRMIWDYLAGCGQSTIQEAVAKLKLSFPTVTRTVEYGKKLGFIQEGAMIGGGVGRKAQVYALNGDYAHYLLIAVDNGFFHYSVYRCTKEIIFQGKKRFDYADFYPSLLALVRELATQDEVIKSVAIALDGITDRGKIVEWSRNTAMNGFPLVDRLSADTGLRVGVDNNMKAATLSVKSYLCNAREKTVCVFQNGHSGYGVGFLICGEPVRGMSNFAGEISYLPHPILRIGEERAFMHFFRTVIAMIAPDYFVYYAENESTVCAAKENLERVIPSYALPQFLSREDFLKDCAEGLFTIANDDIARVLFDA